MNFCASINEKLLNKLKVAGSYTNISNEHIRWSKRAEEIKEQNRLRIVSSWAFKIKNKQDNNLFSKLFVLFVLYLKPQDATIWSLFCTLFVMLSNISGWREFVDSFCTLSTFKET